MVAEGVQLFKKGAVVYSCKEAYPAGWRRIFAAIINGMAPMMAQLKQKQDSLKTITYLEKVFVPRIISTAECEALVEATFDGVRYRVLDSTEKYKEIKEAARSGGPSWGESVAWPIFFGAAHSYITTQVDFRMGGSDPKFQGDLKLKTLYEDECRKDESFRKMCKSMSTHHISTILLGTIFHYNILTILYTTIC